MEEKIEMEEEKLRSAASMDNSYTKMLFSSNVPLIGKAWYLQVRARTLIDMCQKIIYLYLSTPVSTRAVAGSHQLDGPAEAAQQPGGGQGRAEEDQVCRAHGAAGPNHHHRSALVLVSRV